MFGLFKQISCSFCVTRSNFLQSFLLSCIFFPFLGLIYLSLSKYLLKNSENSNTENSTGFTLVQLGYSPVALLSLIQIFILVGSAGCIFWFYFFYFFSCILINRCDSQSLMQKTFSGKTVVVSVLAQCNLKGKSNSWTILPHHQYVFKFPKFLTCVCVFNKHLQNSFCIMTHFSGPISVSLDDHKR